MGTDRIPGEAHISAPEFIHSLTAYAGNAIFLQSLEQRERERENERERVRARGHIYNVGAGQLW